MLEAYVIYNDGPEYRCATDDNRISTDLEVVSIDFHLLK